MVERVRVDGHYVDSLGPVAGMVDSTIVRRDGWSGDYQASCQVAPVGRAGLPSWTRRGAVYEHVGEAGRTWGGLMTEPTPNGDGTWTLAANGFGIAGDDYESYTLGTGGAIVPTFIPDDGIDEQIDQGLPWLRLSSLSSTAVVSLDGKLVTISTLLTADALTKGKFWYVDSWGLVSYADFATVPLRITAPTPDYGGTADENYVSHLYVQYVSSVDGTTGEPDGWSWVLAGPDALRDEIETQYGRKVTLVELDEKGWMTETVAQDYADAMFAADGGRMGYTRGLDLNTWNLRRMGWGPSNPMGMYGRNGAGTLLRIPGSFDTHSKPTTLAHWDVQLGEVQRIHDEQRVAVTPFGFEARDLKSVTIDTAVKARKAVKRGKIIGGPR